MLILPIVTFDKRLNRPYLWEFLIAWVNSSWVCHLLSFVILSHYSNFLCLNFLRHKLGHYEDELNITDKTFRILL